MKPRIWKTQDGRDLSFDKLTQQHLSNIFWYHLIVNPSLDIRVLAVNELEERFSSHSYIASTVSDKLYYYNPTSKSEIEFLRDRGKITDFGDIYHNGHIVGFLEKVYSETEKLEIEIRKEIGI